MKRGRSASAPTKAQVRRFEAIKEIGCIACRKVGAYGVPSDIHHLTVGGKHGQKRRGHDFTIGLCRYHHVGTPSDLRHHYDLGPSYALEPRKFRETFGTDDELLAYQNRLIGMPIPEPPEASDV